MFRQLLRWLVGGRMEPVPVPVPVEQAQVYRLTAQQALNISLQRGFYAVEWSTVQW